MRKFIGAVIVVALAFVTGCGDDPKGKVPGDGYEEVLYYNGTHMYRIRCPGGWVYFSSAYNGWGCFVPDPAK